MKIKIFVLVVTLSLLLSVMLVTVGGEVTDEGESVGEEVEENETQSAQEIHDWYDLNNTRDDLDGDYVLMNDLDNDTAGYDGYNNKKEDYEVEEDAGYEETWDNGDSIDIHFDDEEDYESISVKDEAGNAISHTVGEDTITIDEDTGERFVYVTYENAVVGWDPIGESDYREDLEFTGTFDGNGYEISGLYINRPETRLIGLFGYIDEGGEITNIGVVKANVSGYRNVGILLGHNRDGTVSNSYADGHVNGNEYVGGLVGSKNEGTIENSHYNIDEVLINGGHYITRTGLFDAQYQDWIEDKNLDIADYSDTLVPSGDYYGISGVDGLRNLLGFANYEEYSFRLTENIDLSDETGLNIPYLSAEFNGDNYTISNPYVDIPFASYVGVFGEVSGVIRNLGVIDTTMSANTGVGGLVGLNRGGTVENSYTTGHVSGEGGYIGGLIGVNINSGTVLNSYSISDVSGDYLIGGLLGGDLNGTVSNSYATGNVSGKNSAGGLVGDNWEGTIENSYATGNVSGDRNIGGLIGSNTGPVKNSYATGEVSGEEEVGGLVGDSSHTGDISVPITSSYAIGNVSGNSSVGGFVGANTALVSKSYATGNVSGNSSVGGFVGENSGTECTVSNSYATGNVSGNSSVGGFVGYNDGEYNLDPVIENSYARGNVTRKNGSAETSFGGFAGYNFQGRIVNSYSTGQVIYEEDLDPTDKGFAGSIDTGYDYEMSGNFWDNKTSQQDTTAGEATGKNTTEMKTKSTFTSTGWDFTNIWCIDENVTYPLFMWDQVVRIEISPEPTATVSAGESLQFTVQAFDQDDTLITDKPTLFTWKNADEHGVFKKTETGTYDVTATYGKVSDPTTVTVEPAEVDSVLIKPDEDFSLIPGETENFTAKAYDQYYNLIEDDDAEFMWENTSDSGLFDTIEVGNHKVTATYEGVTSEAVIVTVLNEYNLTINVDGEGNTTPEKGKHTYWEGEIVTIEATPAEDWNFDKWTGDSTGTDQMINVTMDKDKNITAHFEKSVIVETYNLTVNIEGEGKVEVNGEEVEDGWTSEFDEGTNVTLEAIPHDDWNFDMWTGDFSSLDKEINITMDGDIEITANFEEEEGGDEGDIIPTIPGFTSALLLLAVIAAVAIYRKKKWYN